MPDMQTETAAGQKALADELAAASGEGRIIKKAKKKDSTDGPSEVVKETAPLETAKAGR